MVKHLLVYKHVRISMGFSISAFIIIATKKRFQKNSYFYQYITILKSFLVCLKNQFCNSFIDIFSFKRRSMKMADKFFNMILIGMIIRFRHIF